MNLRRFRCVFAVATVILACAGPLAAQTTRTAGQPAAARTVGVDAAHDFAAEAQSLIDDIAHRIDDAARKGEPARRRLTVSAQNAWREFENAVNSSISAGAPTEAVKTKWRAFTDEAAARAPLSGADFEVLRELAFRRAYDDVRRALTPAVEKLDGAAERLQAAEQELQRAEAHLRSHSAGRGAMAPFQPVVPGVAAPTQLSSVSQLEVYIKDMKARTDRFSADLAQTSRELSDALAEGRGVLDRIAALRAGLPLPGGGEARQAKAEPARSQGAHPAATDAAPLDPNASAPLAFAAGAMLERACFPSEPSSAGGSSCTTTDNLKIDVGKTPKDPSVVTFRWDVSKVAAAGGVRWQITRGGFPVFAPQTAFAVPHLVAGGDAAGPSGSFKFDFANLKTISDKPAPAPSGEGASVKPIVGGGAVGAPAAPVTTGAAQIGMFPESYSVRIIPVTTAGGEAVAGQASNIIEIVYDPTAKPKTNPMGTWSSSLSGIVVSKFQWVPYEQHAKWPPGCKEAGGDEYDFSLSTAWKYLSGAFNWVTTAWNDAKAFGVDIIHSALPFIPEDAISAAMDGALLAAGVPPNIPNLDKLMNSGADYLAAQLVEQVPVPDDVAKDLTGQEKIDAILAFKSTLKEEAKKAMLAAAKKTGEKLNSGGDDVYCHLNIQYPWIRLLIRNNGAETVEHVNIQLTDSAKLFDYLNFAIPALQPGEEITIPVAPFTYEHMAIGAKHWPECDSQLVQKQASCNLGKNASIWWNKAMKEKYSFTVTGPVRRDCHKESGKCFLAQGVLYASEADAWLTRAN